MTMYLVTFERDKYLECRRALKKEGYYVENVFNTIGVLVVSNPSGSLDELKELDGVLAAEVSGDKYALL